MTLHVYAVRALSGAWLMAEWRPEASRWTWTDDRGKAWTAPTWGEAAAIASHFRDRLAHPVSVEVTV